MTGAVCRFLLSTESRLPALLTVLSIFGVLWALRTLSYRRDDRTQFGVGDVYLIAGFGMWFSFPAVVWVISVSAVSGGVASKKSTSSVSVARKRQ
ncbi:prepilin peptidase [Candidatus Williamhamiltonella defendens]|uniref:prepilin peptidase n=1 Tax=Candidatus Williamhamiltonella defendens TaxID=138072 RepID=UPI00130E7CED|nr:prepilin peptidase [Candidatus Hamiltonella defensa]